MKRSSPRLRSTDVHPEIDRLLLNGSAQTANEAEEQFLNAHLSDIAELAVSLTDEEFVAHEAVKLLFSHGSRPWEDSPP
ncbi:MAG: hypothetical protein JWN51_3658 [Phycisphaerales bacterium]|nr:hypothetical protein [Phycisphaerales bacterium]